MHTEIVNSEGQLDKHKKQRKKSIKVKEEATPFHAFEYECGVLASCSLILR